MNSSPFVAVVNGWSFTSTFPLCLHGIHRDTCTSAFCTFAPETLSAFFGLDRRYERTTDIFSSSALRKGMKCVPGSGWETWRKQSKWKAEVYVQYNIKVDLKDRMLRYAQWANLALDRVWCRVPVNTAINSNYKVRKCLRLCNWMVATGTSHKDLLSVKCVEFLDQLVKGVAFQEVPCGMQLGS